MLTHPCQELYKLGILYDGESIPPDQAAVECSVQAVDEHISAPLYTLRPSRTSRPKLSRRGNPKRQLYLSLSNLSSDIDIAQWLSPHPSPTKQHRDSLSNISTDIPLSLLPTTLAFDPGALSNSQSNFLANDTDWTFINQTQTENNMQSPSSEPETWILLSDDL